MNRHVAIGALAVAVCGGAHAQSNEELKATLDQAMKTIQDLQARVKNLEQKEWSAAGRCTCRSGCSRRGTRSGRSSSTRGRPGGCARDLRGLAGAGGRARPGQGQGRVLRAGDARRDLRRQAHESRLGRNAAAVADPDHLPGLAGLRQGWHHHLQRAAVEPRVQVVHPDGLGEVKTDMSFDLFGTNGGTQIHWLNAWAELGMFGAGQTYSNFMDIDVFPNTIDYWGPSGMVFVRNPQLRFTPWNKDGNTFAISLESPNSAIDTGRITRVDPALGASITGWNAAAGPRRLLQAGARLGPPQGRRHRAPGRLPEHGLAQQRSVRHAHRLRPEPQRRAQGVRQGQAELAGRRQARASPAT